MERLSRIKVMLAEKQKTNKWLAEKPDRNITTVSRWCANSSQPDILSFVKIAELPDVKIEKLLMD